jgi:hypothetical protein
MLRRAKAGRKISCSNETAGRFAQDRAESGQENKAMPPLVVFAMGVLGAAVLARWCVKEVHRFNAEIDEMRA